MKNNYTNTEPNMFIKLINNQNFYTSDGRINQEVKFNIDIPEFNIQRSEIIGKPEDKFETLLFLPTGEERKGEGGLRTKGYFKFSYKLVDNQWFICDLDGNPVKPAPEEVQEKILSYINSSPNEIQHQITELPLITVITVVLNGEKYLEQTIQSVINQTYPNVEYIIIDGGSTDGTLNIIKKYEDKIDYWVSEKDKGIYDAMNKGIYLAMGKWLNFMNSGDNFCDYKVIEDVFLKNYPNFKKCSIVYGNWIVDFDGDIYQFYPSNLKKLKTRMVFAHNSSFFRLLSLKKQGVYNTDYKIAADYDLIQRFYFKQYNFCHVHRNISVQEGIYGVSNTSIINAIIERFLVRINSSRNIAFTVIDFIPECILVLFMLIWRKFSPKTLRKIFVRLRNKYKINRAEMKA